MHSGQASYTGSQKEMFTCKYACHAWVLETIFGMLILPVHLKGKNHNK